MGALGFSPAETAELLTEVVLLAVLFGLVLTVGLMVVLIPRTRKQWGEFVKVVVFVFIILRAFLTRWLELVWDPWWDLAFWTSAGVGIGFWVWTMFQEWGKVVRIILKDRRDALE